MATESIASALGNQRYVTLVPKGAQPARIPTAVGDVVLDQDWADATHLAWGTAPGTLSDLASDQRLPDATPTTLVNWLALSLTGEWVAPAVRERTSPKDNDTRGLDRANLALLRRSLDAQRVPDQRDLCVLASPVTGAGVVLDPVTARLLAERVGLRTPSIALGEPDPSPDGTGDESLREDPERTFNRHWLPTLRTLGIWLG